MPLVTTRTMDKAIRDAQGLEHPRRMQIPSEGFPWSIVAFGYKINPDGDNHAEVVIYGGALFGQVTNFLTASDTKLVISGDQTACVHYAFPATLTIEAHDTIGFPSDGNSDRYYRLYEFSESDGNVSLYRIKHIGNIYDGRGLKTNVVLESGDTLVFINGSLHQIIPA